jgi:hypothetical protein
MSEMRTSRSDCGKGSGRSSTLSTIENMAVVAPIPKANIEIAVAENPGDLRSRRTV